ncbi:hypothetical protein ACSLBF_11270 [Pseudoalteromonas sp. T1lg65]|uniref:hypothetical protein n=1 Tax=Pseudoalteromonas sp. T1lg65 TaxID=2077101 RepID=UPI003F79BBB8
MIKKLSLICAVVAMSAQSHENIYDTDSEPGISTQYTQGPISKVLIQSRSALNISALFFVTDPDTQCTKARVINENTWQPLAELTIHSNTALSGTLPSGYESAPKSLQITCHSENETYTVHHKIPAAPQITWDSEVEVSDWVDGNHAGYYNNIDYTSTAFIDNKAPDGECFFTKHVGATPNIIETKNELPFSSEYFSTSGSALGGGEHAYIYLVSRIICQNAGGVTVAVEAWDLGYDHHNAPDRDYSVYSY